MKSSRLLVGTLVLCLSLIVMPGGVQAATWQVDSSGGGDFLTIQAAVDNAAAGDLINVVAGHYLEQVSVGTDNLTIAGAGPGVTFIDSPTQLTDYFIIGSYYFPVVLVQGCDGVVFSDLTLDGRGQGDTNPLFQGFGYFNAGGGLVNVAITGVRGATLNAMPHGNGVFAVATDLVTHTFDLTDVTIAEFQKSGVVLDGTGLGGTLTRVAVSGQGTTGAIAQNGFQVSRDAGFVLNDCTVSGLNYTGGIWAATALLGTSGTSVTMTNCQVTGCQTSVYMIDNVASFADGSIANPFGDGMVVTSSGAKKSSERLLPQPVSIAVQKSGFTKALVSLSVSNSVITGSDMVGSWGIAASSAGQITLTMNTCVVTHFEHGFVVEETGGTVGGQARDCDFTDNLTLGGWSNTVVDYDARQNWWGHITGPFHAVKNPLGLGAEITDHILFDPWTLRGPGIIASVSGPDPIRCGITKPVIVTYLPDPLGPPTRGIDITVRITGPATATDTDVVDLNGLGAVGTHQFYAADNGDGTITISDALLGPTPGLLATADICQINVQTIGDGPVGVEIVGYRLRDLDNQPLYAPVMGTTFNVDCVAPAAVTALTATPAHNRVDVSWLHDDVDVDHYEVFRGLWHDGTIGQSAYPEYDDVAAATPSQRPATWAEADADPEWALAGTTTVGVHAFADAWPDATDRGVYTYEVFAVDAVLNGDAAAANARATNYWLGDVAGSPASPPPNGQVNVFDMSELGTHFGDTVPTGDPSNVLDVGPTDDFSRLGVPDTDDVINFEDLIIFSMNFGVVTSAKGRGQAATTVDLAWSARDDGTQVLSLVNGTGLKGLRVQLAQPVSDVAAGRLVAEQDSPTFFRNVGANLDANLAVLGVNTPFVGSGELLVVRGAKKIETSELLITARGTDNSELKVRFGQAATTELPRTYALHANYPNPFNPQTVISYALPAAQQVRLAVYGVDGRRLVTLVDGQQAAGVHDVVWQGRDAAGQNVAAGTYFYRLEAGPFSQVRKMALIK